jgi:hypothetical protein
MYSHWSDCFDSCFDGQSYHGTETTWNGGDEGGREGAAARFVSRRREERSFVFEDTARKEPRKNRSALDVLFLKASRALAVSEVAISLG